MISYVVLEVRATKPLSFMRIEFNLMLVKGHSVYTFRLYLTTQKSPVHIENLVQLTERRLNRHRDTVVSERG